ncbi:GNAT family N-acetyltransferase [Streptomyces sp. RFCAC02]|uniref:GNAT family N-acetyltransferase n=1 Tax=Streptomyces sp. RFCAC02 TaxID=2499143 RepID=UPI0010224B35|nr:GNAT family N-acetyltransferase [Streptomyces sp. RFCAC02]
MGGQLVVRITPADVGKRVSVRSLTGPGEPAAVFTDTVGILTSWADGVVAVTRRDGRTVPLAEADLVAGKVVPAVPRPVRRGTPVASARDLLAVAARGWCGTGSERIGDWLARACGGWTRRANSAVAVGEGEPDLDRLTAWYAARGLPATVQIATGGPDGTGAGERLTARLERLGWSAGGHVQARVAPLASLTEQGHDPRVVVARELPDAWLRPYRRVRENPEAARQVLRGVPGGPAVLFASVPDPAGGNDPVAFGRCAVDGRWAGFGALVVDPAHRRRGLAVALMGELARAALAEGASAAYLHVETDNAPAIALYDRLGLTLHSHCHYRVRP